MNIYIHYSQRKREGLRGLEPLNILHREFNSSLIQINCIMHTGFKRRNLLDKLTETSHTLFKITWFILYNIGLYTYIHVYKTNAVEFIRLFPCLYVQMGNPFYHLSFTLHHVQEMRHIFSLLMPLKSTECH